MYKSVIYEISKDEDKLISNLEKITKIFKNDLDMLLNIYEALLDEKNIEDNGKRLSILEKVKKSSVLINDHDKLLKLYEAWVYSHINDDENIFKLGIKELNNDDLFVYSLYTQLY